MLSSRQRARLTNLFYKVSAKIVPDCDIRRDPLHRRYPDTNWGTYANCDTLEQAQLLKETMERSLSNRGYVPYCRLVQYVYNYDRKPFTVEFSAWKAD